MIIHCLGDSITEAKNLPEKGRWPSCLQMLLDQWKPGKFEVYVNGVGGDTTAMGIERLEDVSRDTGVTLIEFGFNDAACRDWQKKARVSAYEYKENLKAIGMMVKARGGQPIYIVNHRVYQLAKDMQADGLSYTEKVDHYNQIIRDVATALKSPSIDLPAIMIKKNIDPKIFYKDCVHLTAEGNRIYAGMVFEELMPILEKSI